MDKLRYGQLDQASLIFCFSLVVAGPINQPSHTSCASLLSLSRITIGDSRQMVALSLCNHICDGATILKSCLVTNRGYGSVVGDIRGISSDYSGGTKCCHNLVCSGCHRIPPTRCHRKHVYCIMRFAEPLPAAFCGPEISRCQSTCRRARTWTCRPIDGLIGHRVLRMAPCP